MVYINLLGISNWRSNNQPFGIKIEDRFRHIYCIGQTGVGKSTLLLNLAISDIQQGYGVCIIDPHGDLCTTLLHHISKQRINDVFYFNPEDKEFPLSFNPLEITSGANLYLVASGIVDTFKKIWAESWGPRLEYILRYSLLTLLEFPHATLLDIQPLLTDSLFRSNVLAYCTQHHLLDFWQNEFEKYPPALKAEAIAPILNKVGQLLSSTTLRTILGQPKSSFHMQDILNSSKILICNFSKGHIGEDASALLGSLMLSQIKQAAFLRADLKEQDRLPFFVYIDEMQSFITMAFIELLAEARKYKVGLFLTHQYLEQVHDEIRGAIFGNVGTIVSFRVGASDAELLSREFGGKFEVSDFVALPKYSMYLKLMIDGTSSIPFSATSIGLPPINKSFELEIIAASRRYAPPTLYGAKVGKQQTSEKTRTLFE